MRTTEVQLQQLNLRPAQLFDRHSQRHAATANHIF